MDWVRVPADEREVATRVVGLLRRAAIGHTNPAGPDIDDHDRLHHDGGWVALSPTEARIARLLCDHFTDVVSEDDLLRNTWSDDRHERRRPALRVHLTRLRQRVAPLGLEIRAVRGQGMVLQPSGTPQAPAPVGADHAPPSPPWV
jgi:DNA-binding response OmpR family regulator